MDKYNPLAIEEKWYKFGKKKNTLNLVQMKISLNLVQLFHRQM